MRNFRKLEIWKSAIELVTIIYELTSRFPSNEKYGLSSQMQRAAVSIPSNIAEGCSRNSQIEYKRFLEIAMGSSFELETQLEIVNKIQLLNHEEYKSVLENLHKLQRQINSLINRIKTEI